MGYFCCTCLYLHWYGTYRQIHQSISLMNPYINRYSRTFNVEITTCIESDAVLFLLSDSWRYRKYGLPRYVPIEYSQKNLKFVILTRLTIHLKSLSTIVTYGNNFTPAQHLPVPVYSHPHLYHVLYGKAVYVQAMLVLVRVLVLPETRLFSHAGR
jgi:hypothetical protein